MQTYHFTNFCDPGWIRTSDLLLRRQLLYPAELRDQASILFAERGGFEPPVQFNPYDSLANYWFQPLTHLSGWKKNANISQNDLISTDL
jgi:hypothetical protein